MPGLSLRRGNMCAGCRCGADHLRGHRCAPVTTPAPVRHVCRILPSDCTRDTILLPLCPGRQRGTRSGIAARRLAQAPQRLQTLAAAAVSAGVSVVGRSAHWTPFGVWVYTHPTQLAAGGRMRALACASLHVGRLAATPGCWDECTTPEPPDFPTFCSAGNPLYYARYYDFAAPVLPRAA